VFDLDPDPKLDWQLMLDAAELTRTLLDELGLESFCKTSGGKGLHVVVPIQRGGDWDGVKSFAQAIAQHLANTIPERFSAKMGPQNRVGKIFVDYLRNNRGSSTVAAFSARARHGMGVSTPVRWSEVPKLESGDQWNVRNIAQRFAELNDDPWADYGRTRQKITATVRNKLRR
jgi:bifunctional non-homologous end joining protein LigD